MSHPAIKVADGPAEMTAFAFIKSHLDWDDASRAVLPDGAPRLDPGLTLPDFVADPEAVLGDVTALYAKVGTVHWRSSRSEQLYGVSLNYNPDHPRDLWASGSFGHPRYRSLNATDYYAAVEKDVANRQKGDYLDSYGFRALLPEIEPGSALGQLLDGFAVPVVRSTCRTLNGALCRPAQETGGYHKDDNPLEVLRVNVCLSSNDLFGLQYEGHDPIIPTPGSASIVNTDINHRAWVKARSPIHRTHLVIGLAPWFDYDPAADAFSPNQYFGRLHPYDMARQGLLLKSNRSFS